MAVPGVVLLIPKFLVLNQLGMYDSYSGMIVPLLADAAGVFIMKQFFESIPVSVEEAARIDGAGTFRIFWSIVLPMARPALITLTILSFQGSWNELPHFNVSRQSPELNTLTSGVPIRQGLSGVHSPPTGQALVPPQKPDAVRRPKPEAAVESGTQVGRAVEVDDGSRRPCRCRGRQEVHGGGDLCRGADPAERALRPQALALGAGQFGRLPLSGHESRRDGGDRDAVRGECHRQ
jgi:hypothetical protein